MEEFLESFRVARYKIKRRLTKNSRSFCHKKTDKTHSFAKRGRAKAQERRELGTLCET